MTDNEDKKNEVDYYLDGLDSYVIRYKELTEHAPWPVKPIAISSVHKNLTNNNIVSEEHEEGKRWKTVQNSFDAMFGINQHPLFHRDIVRANIFTADQIKYLRKTKQLPFDSFLGLDYTEQSSWDESPAVKKMTKNKKGRP